MTAVRRKERLMVSALAREQKKNTSKLSSHRVELDCLLGHREGGVAAAEERLGAAHFGRAREDGAKTACVRSFRTKSSKTKQKKKQETVPTVDASAVRETRRKLGRRAIDIRRRARRRRGNDLDLVRHAVCARVRVRRTEKQKIQHNALAKTQSADEQTALACK